VHSDSQSDEPFNGFPHKINTLMVQEGQQAIPEAGCQRLLEALQTLGKQEHPAVLRGPRSKPPIAVLSGPRSTPLRFSGITCGLFPVKPTLFVSVWIWRDCMPPRPAVSTIT